MDELLALGCNQTGGLNCNNGPGWLNNTSYWIKRAYSGYGNALLYNRFANGTSDDYAGYSNDNKFGIRPVITISSSEI